MKSHVILVTVTIAIATSAYAYAMTNQRAEALANAAMHGNLAALSKLKSAVQGGDANAESWLGSYFRANHHYKQGLRWLMKSAAQNNAGGEFRLGVAYDNGQGVPQNYAKADYWYQKAADKGLADAEYNLGVLYNLGYGVQKDVMTALHWFKKAEATGFQPAVLAVTRETARIAAKQEAPAEDEAEAMAEMLHRSAERTNSNILAHETSKYSGYTCKYYNRRGDFYGYASQNNNVYYFKPEINNKNYILVSKTNISGLGGLYFVSSMSEISCTNRCRVLKIGKYSRNDLSLSGMLLPAHDAKYKVMDSNTIYGSAMDDLIHGCMASTVRIERYKIEKTNEKNETIEQKEHTQYLLGVLANEISNKIKKQVGLIPKKYHICTIKFKLNRLGKVVGNPKIVKSCGSDLGNKNAIKAIENAAPFPIPSGLPFYLAKTVSVHYPFW